MILRYRLRKSFNARPGFPGRDSQRMTRASDIILLMLAGLLVTSRYFGSYTADRTTVALLFLSWSLL
ncbi:conserved hypothetical protein [Rhizobium mesoamericanum STM3625]|uniref:Uncharacterized protein n=1 Tax=Rhizobium mesoamericanum STM3625 TaxID=1211777 RepID=K0Q0T1_9HYPH|nr:conserved hypothetical protein [Rhizobium mesoamericanum STM3625]